MCIFPIFGPLEIRISEGKDAPPGDWPWMAILGYNKYGVQGPSFECGGTLISLRTVLTGAHCLERFANSIYFECDGSAQELFQVEVCFWS